MGHFFPRHNSPCSVPFGGPGGRGVHGDHLPPPGLVLVLLPRHEPLLHLMLELKQELLNVHNTEQD